MQGGSAVTMAEHGWPHRTRHFGPRSTTRDGLIDSWNLKICHKIQGHGDLPVRLLGLSSLPSGPLNGPRELMLA